MPKRLSSRSSHLPSADRKRSKNELLKELKMLRRQYVTLKFLEREHDDALAAIKGSQDKYRAIVETANDIICRTDARGNFAYANHAAVRIIGYPIKELLGKSFTTSCALLSEKGNATLLIATGEDLLREVVAGILKEHGYTVAEGADGIRAVDVFHEQPSSHQYCAF
jgi:PAS domain-containing protein